MLTTQTYLPPTVILLPDQYIKQRTEQTVNLVCSECAFSEFIED